MEKNIPTGLASLESHGTGLPDAEKLWSEIRVFLARKGVSEENTNFQDGRTDGHLHTYTIQNYGFSFLSIAYRTLYAEADDIVSLHILFEGEDGMYTEELFFPESSVWAGVKYLLNWAS